MKIRLGPEVEPGVNFVERKEDDGRSSVGLLRKAEDGTALHPGEEYVDVGPPDRDGWREGTVLFGGDGPAQVATPQYREGYDRIFGKKTEVGLA